MGAVAAAVVATMLAAMPAQALTVVNGDFETGDFTGWILGGETLQSVVFDAGAEIPVYAGNYSAAFGPLNGMGTLSQSFQVVPGATYTLSYALSNFVGRRGTSFSLAFGDTNFSMPNGFVAFPFGRFTVSTLATGHTLDLTFNFLHDGYWLIDEIHVAGLAVPEPATWVLLLAGLGAVAGLARRGRAADGAIDKDLAQRPASDLLD